MPVAYATGIACVQSQSRQQYENADAENLVTLRFYL